MSLNQGGKPRLLDLFCGAGGAAMGYHRAGFEVVGVDIKDQPHYPFAFIEQDALEFLACRAGLETQGWDAIHASPPCQRWSVLGQSHRNAGKEYPDLLTPIRPLLAATGLPFVIENVPGAPMRPDLVLCGQQFGWNVRRHRWFECNWPVSPMAFGCVHERPVVVSGNNHSGGFTANEIKEAMRMPWAGTRYEVRQAIPWVFTEYVGRHLLGYLISRSEATS